MTEFLARSSICCAYSQDQYQRNMQLNGYLLIAGNPHYLPEVTAKALVVDFGVRQPGLEAQLLDAIVRHERPDLDQQKGELVLKVAQGKQTQVGSQAFLICPS